MTHQTPSSTPSLEELARAQQNVVAVAQLRACGVSGQVVAERCRSDGPWRQILPRVVLLQPGPPTPEQRLWAALLYAGDGGAGPGAGPLITGAAALAMYGFSSAPRLPAVTEVDVLVPRQRRLRGIPEVRIRRTSRRLAARSLRGLPCVPVSRAVADALLDSDDAVQAWDVLWEAVSCHGCGVRELGRALAETGSLDLPWVRSAWDELLAGARDAATTRLTVLVRRYGLPEPLGTVELRMPGGTFVALPDAYWPEQGVALEIDPEARYLSGAEAAWARDCRHRMEYLGLAVVRLAAERLEREPERVVRELHAALSATERDTALLRIVPR